MILLSLLAVIILALPALDRAGRGTRYVDIRAVVCNDDWATAGTNLPDLIARGVDVIFVQEGRRARYRELRDRTGTRLLPFVEYGVVQDAKSLARAGSVVIWKLATFKQTAVGYTFAVQAPGLMARYIAWVRASLHGRRVWLWSAHRPPIRDRRWWRPFDLAFRARVHLALASGRLVIGGMDSNQRGGPHYGIHGLKWVAVTGSIDGFIVSTSIRVVSVEELPRGTSDHHPVIAHLRVPV